MHKTTRLIGSILLIAFLVTMLGACRRATPTSPIFSLPTVPNPNKIEDVSCPFITESSGPKVTCGKLAVPEDYMNPQGTQIHLFVVIVHSTGDIPAKDPVIVLYQDYGGPFAENAGRYAAYDPFLSEILKKHDLVLYDMRGVGLSGLDIACSDVAPALAGIMGQKLNRDARAKASAEVLLACRDKLIQSGIHLENYTTAQNVADLSSVTMALEAEKVNLLTTGYGSYLSLRVMQDNPDRIRSALLSSPYNGQILAYNVAAKLQNGLTMVFESCKANEKCFAAYPSLEEDFYAAVEKLNHTPAEITLTGTFLNGQEFPVVVTGDAFLDLTRAMISRPSVSDLPSLVYYINLDRNYHLIEPMQLVQGYVGYGNPGVEISVYCQAYLEEKGKSRPKVQTNGLKNPDQALLDWQAFGQQADELTCSDWFAGKTELSENPGRPSSVPALVIYGERNTYAPPDWVEDNLKSFTKAELVKFPNTGWVDWAGNCITQLATTFLDNPTTQLDTSCAKGTPVVNFTVPMK